MIVGGDSVRISWDFYRKILRDFFWWGFCGIFSGNFFEGLCGISVEKFCGIFCGDF